MGGVGPPMVIEGDPALGGPNRLIASFTASTRKPASSVDNVKNLSHFQL